MSKLLILCGLLLAAHLATAPLATATPISVYGAWHCGNDYCTWSRERDLADFALRNRWLVDRGDGSPSVNVVVLSFVHPLRLLQQTIDAQTLEGVPRGMNQAVVIGSRPAASASCCRSAASRTSTRGIRRSPPTRRPSG